MFWPFLTNVDISLSRQLYSKNTVLFNLTTSENNAFSASCNICRKLVKPIIWSTNTMRYLYSFWVSLVVCWVKLNNNTCYFFQLHEKWNLPFSSVLLLISTDSTFPNDLKRSLCMCHSEKRRFNFKSAC